MSKVAKKLFFDVDGVGRINAMPGATFTLGGNNRTPVNADNGPVGFSEEPVEPKITGIQVPNDGTVSMEQINALTNVNVTIQDDNGKTYIQSGSYTPAPCTQSNGMISFDFNGLRTDAVS